MCYNVFIGETSCTQIHRASRAGNWATCAGRAARAGLTSACGLVVAGGVQIAVPGQPLLARREKRKVGRVSLCQNRRVPSIVMGLIPIIVERLDL